MKTKARLLFIVGFVGAALIAAVILFYFYTDGLRVLILKPLIEAYYISHYYLGFVPQLYLWIIPPLIIVLIMGRRLVRFSKSAHPVRIQKNPSVAPGEGELALLTQQIHRARHSRFARVRLSRTLVEIGARLIAGREGSPLWHARRQLSGGYWRDHLSIHWFLTPRRHYTIRQSGVEFDNSLQEVIEHLEEFADHV